MNLKAFVLILLGVVFSVKQAQAQFVSINGQFETDQLLGCYDLTVTVTNIDPGTDPSVIVFQFDGSSSPTTQNPVHTYTSPGTYWINQYIQGATGQKKDSIQITVVSPEFPDIELFSCNNFEVTVQIYDTYYDMYEVDYGDGTIIQVNAGDPVPAYTYANGTTRNLVVTGLFTTATNRCGINAKSFSPTATVLPAQVDSLIILNNNSFKLNYQLPANSVNKLEVSVGNNTNYVLYQNLNQNTTVDTLTTLNLTQNQYCFRISTYDACSNFRSYSNEVCTASIMSSAQNNQITINWNTISIGASQSTDLMRDGVLLNSFPSNITQHIDSTVVCNTDYCYNLEISFPGGGITHSQELCNTAFSNDLPPSIEYISSITSDSVYWTWEVPSGTTPAYYIVNVFDNLGTTIANSTSQTNQFVTYLTEEVQQINVSIHDSCDNESATSVTGNNILLTGTQSSTGDIEVTWNSHAGWIDGIQEYYITIKDVQGNVLDSISTGTNTSYSISIDQENEQTLVIAVWAVPINATAAFSRSNELIFERTPVLAIPNSFTPNGDGLNDRFIIHGRFIDSFELHIYDRWGEMLFHTTDIDTGWDGTRNGKKISTGNYAYWIRVKDLNNNEHIRTGSILILSN